MKRERLKYFDALKTFAILMVIWGHCIQYFLSSNHQDEPIYRIIYSFHMPLFMMISGFFASSGLKKPFMKATLARASQLLVPCLSTALLLAVIYGLLTERDAIYTFKFQLMHALWFLKTAFFCFVMARLCFLCGKYKYIALLFSLAIAQLPHMRYVHYFTTNIDIMYPSFVVGILIKEHLIFFKQQSKSIMIVAGIIFGGMLLFYYKEFWQSTHNLFYELKAMNLDEAFYLIYIRFYKLAIGVAGSIFFIALFYRFFNNNRLNKAIDAMCDMGKYTLGIYVIQFIFLEELVLSRIINFDGTNFWIFNLVIAPFLSVVILVMCTLVVRLIEKNKILAFLFLGNKL